MTDKKFLQVKVVMGDGSTLVLPNVDTIEADNFNEWVVFNYPNDNGSTRVKATCIIFFDAVRGEKTLELLPEANTEPTSH